eukprot:gene12212-biopygen2600
MEGVSATCPLGYGLATFDKAQISVVQRIDPLIDMLSEFQALARVARHRPAMPLNDVVIAHEQLYDMLESAGRWQPSAWRTGAHMTVASVNMDNLRMSTKQLCKLRSIVSDINGRRSIVYQDPAPLVAYGFAISQNVVESFWRMCRRRHKTFTLLKAFQEFIVNIVELIKRMAGPDALGWLSRMSAQDCMPVSLTAIDLHAIIRELEVVGVRRSEEDIRVFVLGKADAARMLEWLHVTGMSVPLWQGNPRGRKKGIPGAWPPWVWYADLRSNKKPICVVLGCGFEDGQWRLVEIVELLKKKAKCKVLTHISRNIFVRNDTIVRVDVSDVYTKVPVQYSWDDDGNWMRIENLAEVRPKRRAGVVVLFSCGGASLVVLIGGRVCQRHH